MIDEIIFEYSDYNNIIDICTLNELKFLEMLINNSERVFNKNEYFFGRRNLINKMLIMDFDKLKISPELYD